MTFSNPCNHSQVSQGEFQPMEAECAQGLEHERKITHCLSGVIQASRRLGSAICLKMGATTPCFRPKYPRSPPSQKPHERGSCAYGKLVYMPPEQTTRCFETNWTAVALGRHNKKQHGDIFFVRCLLTLEPLATIGFNWLGFLFLGETRERICGLENVTSLRQNRERVGKG